MSILIKFNCNNPNSFPTNPLIGNVQLYFFHIEAEIEIGSGACGEWMENDEYHDHFLSLIVYWPRGQYTMEYTLFRMTIPQNILVTWPCFDQWHNSITTNLIYIMIQRPNEAKIFLILLNVLRPPFWRVSEHSLFAKLGRWGWLMRMSMMRWAWKKCPGHVAPTTGS